MLQRSRMRTLAIVCAALFVVLLGRLWYLQIARGKDLMQESEMNRTRLVRVRAPRGRILDRKGRDLATSRPQYVVMAIPEVVGKDKKALAMLCRILGMTNDELAKVMKRDRAARFAPVRIAVDVPLDVVAKLMERKPVLPGVSVERDQLRNYPDGQLCAHVLGYIGEISEKELVTMNQKLHEDSPDTDREYIPGDYVGKSGVEKQYETLLHGVDGGQEIEVDARGRTRRVLKYLEPIPGATLQLTIDKDLQIAAERVMEGKTGAAVAVDPQTGEILAMVSKPDFDPNVFVKRVDPQDRMALFTSKAGPMQNRAITNKYPPGSTFKPITAIAALEYKVATTQTGMVCSGAGLFHRRCWKVHGHVNFTTAISQSCDVFFYEMGRRIGINNLAKTARSFGLSYATGIDLPGEVRRAGDTRKGTVPDEAWKKAKLHERWWPGETVICAIGQGFVETTPLQMALVDAAVSTSGKRFRPHVLREVRDPRGKVMRVIKPHEETPVPASSESFKAVQDAMRQTVIGPGGTGHVVDVPGVLVAGKTGSAESGKYTAAHAWFTCFAPVGNPEIAIAVIAEHGRHGATSAAPVARAILDVYYHKKKPSEIKPGIVHAQGD
jgi:penicillin-binding protein 2